MLLELSGTNLLLALLGATLLVGFGADWLAVRFRIPDVLWLIALGLLAGPLLGLVSPTSLLFVVPVLGSAALILILFDAGIDLQVSLIRPLAGSAVLFSVASYAVSTVILFVTSYLVLFPENLTLSVIFGTTLGCSSGAVIIPLANRLGFAEGLRSFLHLEAAIEDAVAIVTVTTVLLLIVPSSPSFAFTVATSLALPLPVGLGIGLAAGLLWLLFLYAWQDRAFAALATLGFLFTVYAIAESLGGSGIIAAIVFGGVLGNEPVVRRFLRRSRPFRIAADLRKVEVEIAFVLRTFFLFLLGVLVTISLPSVAAGLAVLLLPVVLLAARRGIFTTSTNPRKIPGTWARAVAGLNGRGLTSAVLLTVAHQTVLGSSALFFPALLVIVGTNVVMTVALMVTPTPAVPADAEAERRWAEASDRLLVFAEEDGIPGLRRTTSPTDEGSRRAAGSGDAREGADRRPPFSASEEGQPPLPRGRR